MSQEYAIVNQYIRRTRGASGTPTLPPPNKLNKIKDKIVIPLLKLN